jgi:hypothetical protein
MGVIHTTTIHANPTIICTGSIACPLYDGVDNLQQEIVMYFTDLSPYPYTYGPLEENALVLCVGWLDDSHEYEKGETPSVFKDRLWKLCSESVFSTMGYHPCPFCLDLPVPVMARHDNEEIPLGSAQARVFGQGSKVYAAPNLIYHYVTQHEYKPPDEFIEAVLNSSLPGSQEYKAQMKKYGWDEYF